MKINALLILFVSTSLSIYGASEPQAPSLIDVADHPLAIIGNNLPYRDLGHLSKTAQRFACFFRAKLAEQKKNTELIRYWTKTVECTHLKPSFDADENIAFGLTSAVAFSPQGNFLAYETHATMGLFDLTQRRTLTKMFTTGAPDNHLTLSIRDDNNLYLIETSHSSIRTFKLSPTPQAPLRFEFIDSIGATNQIAAMGVSPDGKQKIFIYTNLLVQIVELNGKKREMFIDAPKEISGQINAVAISPDGNYLAIGLRDARVILFNLITKATTFLPVPTTDPNNRVATSFEFSRDNELLAAGFYAPDQQMGVIIWHVKTQSICLHDAATSASSVAFTPDGKVIAYSTPRNGVIVRNVETDEILNTFPENSRAGTVKFSGDGKCLAAGLTLPSRIAIWCAQTKKVTDNQTTSESK